jgi:hypothetical protein
MRRGAVAKGSKEKPEFSIRFSLVNTEQGENPLLQLGVVNPDTPPGDFIPVQDQVIGTGANGGRIRL